MSLELLLQAAQYIESKEIHNEHGYATPFLFGSKENAHFYKSSKSCSKKHLSGKRSTHNELEKCRRAYLRNCLNKLKDLVPLDPNTYRHTTLGLLKKAKFHIKTLEDGARLLARRKEKLFQEQNGLRLKLASLLVEGDYIVNTSSDNVSGTQLACPNRSDSTAANEVTEINRILDEIIGNKRNIVSGSSSLCLKNGFVTQGPTPHMSALLTPTATILTRGFAGIEVKESQNPNSCYGQPSSTFFTYNLPKGLYAASTSASSSTDVTANRSAFTNLNLSVLGIANSGTTSDSSTNQQRATMALAQIQLAAANAAKHNKLIGNGLIIASPTTTPSQSTTSLVVPAVSANMVSLLTRRNRSSLSQGDNAKKIRTDSESSYLSGYSSTGGGGSSSSSYSSNDSSNHPQNAGNSEMDEDNKLDQATPGTTSTCEVPSAKAEILIDGSEDRFTANSQTSPRFNIDLEHENLHNAQIPASNNDNNNVATNNEGHKEEVFSTSSGFSSENYSADDFFYEEEEDVDDVDEDELEEGEEYDEQLIDSPPMYSSSSSNTTGCGSRHSSSYASGNGVTTESLTPDAIISSSSSGGTVINYSKVTHATAVVAQNTPNKRSKISRPGSQAQQSTAKLSTSEATSQKIPAARRISTRVKRRKSLS